MKRVEKTFFFSNEFEKIYDYYDSLTVEELSQLSKSITVAPAIPENETRPVVATVEEDED